MVRGRQAVGMKMMRKVVAALALAAGLSGSAATAESLADAMIAAYRNSNLLEQNEALLRAADEDVARTLAALRPIIAFAARAASNSYSNSEWSDLAGTVGISADLIIWDYGRGNFAVEAAKETVLATREQLVNIEQSVLLAAVEAYIRVRVAEEVVRLRTNNTRLLGEELRATRDRFEVGEVTRTDVALAEASLAGARAGLSQAEGDLLAAREEYKAATGAYPGRLDATPPMPKTAATQDEAVAVALRTHPLIRQAQREVKVAALNVARAEADMGPTFTGRAEMTTTNNSFETETLSLNYSQTLYAGGGLSAVYRAALARKDAVTSGMLQTGVDVTEAVGRAWSFLSVSAANIEATKQQVEAAQIAYDGMREEANLGARTTLDVLQAEQDLLNAQFARLEAEAERYAAVYRLLASMGLLTVEHLNLGIPTYDPAVYYNAVKNAPSTSPQGKKLNRILKSIQQP